MGTWERGFEEDVSSGGRALFAREGIFDSLACRDAFAGHALLARYPELTDWEPTMERLAVPLRQAAEIAETARRNGTDFQSELMMSGLVSEDGLYRALSDELGIDHTSVIDHERLIVPDQCAVDFLRRRSGNVAVKIAEKDGATSFLITPERLDLGRLRLAVARHPKITRQLKIAAPSALRMAFFERVRLSLARMATSDLFDRYPDFSARIVVNGWQGLVVGATAVGLPVALALAPSQTVLGLHLFFSLFFLSCVALRFLAIRSAVPQRPIPILPFVEADMPVFSILVALYKEAEVVPDLLKALDRLVWPKSKLQIKLVCEDGDRLTLDALARQDLPRFVEVIEVPAIGPRTKPKALAYALPLTSGELIALFDAEDRPDPLQLVQAWQRFDRSGDDLACVQAPLEITNGANSLIAMMFAFEYVALFRGLLPWLARHRLMMPLGGTSNYFRRATLEQVGGWDPHNVTEDADLGVRLKRFGYRCETISCPTYEEAPETIRTWVPQRTRWFKGYLQTWLVHMRNPARLVAEVGIGSFLITQILFAGLVVSALAHPVLVFSAIALAVMVLAGEPLGLWGSVLFAVDTVNIVCGYLSFLMLGWQSLKRHERRRFWRVVALTPAYWMLMSVAAWRAVWQLWRQPHLWEETPHPKARSGVFAAATGIWAPSR